MLLSDDSQVEIPSQPYVVPMVQQGQFMRLSEADVVVLPEITPEPIWHDFRRRGCSLVMHNQNPFYSFKSFPTVKALDEFGLRGGLCCSHFTRNRLRTWGSLIDWQVVKPFVLPIFAETARQFDQGRKRQVVYMPRKRAAEASWVRELFLMRYPQFRDVPWVEIKNRSRKEVAALMAESLIFVSFSHMEGLGLPPLEAMASGCLVVGFTGGGGSEYATSENGRWVGDGDLDSLVDAIALDLALDQQATSERQKAGRRTVHDFSNESFEASLQSAWTQLLGHEAERYQLKTIPFV